MTSLARTARGLAAAAVTACVLLVLVRTSAAPWPYHADDSAGLRLSWSARPERIEVCRTLSAEELARREEHMRQRVECEGRFATYTLVVEADGQRLGESMVRGAGMRHDRPIYLLRDFAMPSGTHRIHVTFTRREQTSADSATGAPPAPVANDTGVFAGRAGRELVERTRRARAAIPARLTLDTVLTFASGQVAVVTLSQEGRLLEVLGERVTPPR